MDTLVGGHRNRDNRLGIRPRFRLVADRHNARRLDFGTLFTHDTHPRIVQVRHVAAPVRQFTRSDAHIVAHGREHARGGLPEIHLEHGTHRIGIGTVDFQGIHEVHRITVEYERRLPVRKLGIDPFAQVDFHGANFLGHRLDRRTQHHRSHLVLDRRIHRELDLFAGILVGIGVMVL